MNEGPKATSATAVASPETETATVTVSFAGSPPFALHPTKNCTSCCGDGDAYHTLDFDVNIFGGFFTNSTTTKLDAQTGAVTFTVLSRGKEIPTVVRYTAASIFPQCALKDASGLPAVPFALPITEG